MANERHDVAFVAGAIVGSAVGAVYGLFSAPQAGWRTRADLSGFAEALGDRVAHRLGLVTVEFRHLIGSDGPDPMVSEAGDFPVREPIDRQGLEPGNVVAREGVITP